MSHNNNLHVGYGVPQTYGPVSPTSTAGGTFYATRTCCFTYEGWGHNPFTCTREKNLAELKGEIEALEQRKRLLEAQMENKRRFFVYATTTVSEWIEAKDEKEAIEKLKALYDDLELENIQVDRS